MTEDAPDAPFARRHRTGLWEDRFGGLGPAKPGQGPRQDPVVDVHAHRDGRAAVFVFYRSAVR